MRRLAVLTLAAVGLVAANRSAEAVPISFSTVGTFSNPTGGCSAGAFSNTISCGGYTLTFSSTPSLQDVPFGFTSVVNFGQIAVTGASNPNEIVGGGSFALQITQDIPVPTGGNPFSYMATLNADLVLTASNSYLQFSAPFINTVTGAPYNVTYNLTEGDDGVMGRSRISGSGQAPLDINGSITPSRPPFRNRRRWCCLARVSFSPGAGCAGRPRKSSSSSRIRPPLVRSNNGRRH